ncbi:hypothetical protein ACQ8FT_004072 [Yersinia enterocolitica]
MISEDVLKFELIYSQLCYSSRRCYTTYGLPVSKNGPVKQAITSIERSYLFLIGGILSGRFDFPNACLICVALLYHRQQGVIQQ